MNGIDNIINRINEEADKTCAEILAQARDRAALNVSEATNTADAEAAAVSKKAKLAAEAEYNRVVSAGQSEGRKRMLLEKRDLIDRAFSEALAKLETLESAQVVSLIVRMASPQIRSGDETLVLPAKYSGIAEEIEAQLKKQTSFTGKLSLSEAISGGLIVARAGAEVNLTFEALIRQHREELEPAVVTALFGE